MQDPVETFKSLRRPSLLVRAARFGLKDYRPLRDLKRILKGEDAGNQNATLGVLLEKEAELEAGRIGEDGNYSVSRHVDVLIALMAEVQGYVIARRAI